MNYLSIIAFFFPFFFFLLWTGYLFLFAPLEKWHMKECIIINVQYEGL